MRFILTIVEQLDRAASELTTDHPINNRLALILIDNATELVLHRQCTDRLARDTMASRLLKAHEAFSKGQSPEVPSALSDDFRKSVMTPKQRTKASGKVLEGKLSVLQALGDLLPDERRFIAIAHEYRNDLYHVGLTHDQITRAVAGHYYLLCCDLFTRMGHLAMFGPTFSSGDRYTDVAKRYLPTRDGRIDSFSIEYEMLAENLRCALPDRLPDLAETLAASAHMAIDEIMDSFGFLVQDNPSGLDCDEVLRLAQWQRDLAEAMEFENVDGFWIDPIYRKEYSRIESSLAATWKQRHSSVPQVKWRLRATAVEREADPLVAMDLYQSLRNDMSYLEEAIESAAAELDRGIQLQIDRARGK